MGIKIGIKQKKKANEKKIYTYENPKWKKKTKKKKKAY